MSNNVIVGSGPIGSAIAQLLVDRGDTVTMVTRSGRGPAHPQIKLVAADASDARRLSSLTEGAATLYNCANPKYTEWEKLWYPMNDAMVAAAKSAGAVYVITGNLYGYGPQPGGHMTESTPLAAVGRKGKVRIKMWRDALNSGVRTIFVQSRPPVARINRRFFVARLGVNVDHVATLRQARGGNDPDPLAAAVLVELAGADGIVVHLREDRRHIQDRDLRLLRELIRTKLDMEMAADETMAKIALTIKPDLVTLVPEKRQELTTEGGLDVPAHKDRLQQVIGMLHDGGIPVSLFIEPDLGHIRAAHKISADFVELHTGRYANAKRSKEADTEFEAITQAAKLAYKLGLGVNAGHGLNYQNVKRLTHIPEIVEYNIGHSIIARAVLVGLDQAVREMKALLN